MLAFSWAIYYSDDGNGYAVKVDNDYLAMPERGWQDAAIVGDLQYPRGWRERQVIGVNAAGGVRYATCASPAADAWTGAVSTFNYRDTNGAIVPASIIGRQAEQVIVINSTSAPRQLSV